MPEMRPSPVISLPQIFLSDDLESALPLEHTLVTVQITGPLAAVVVTQRFGNPLTEPAELDYLFPLPEDAAITGFELQAGSRHIQGDLQERESAREAYEDARSAGKRAGLFEQRRPNLFAVRLANVRAGESIQATVRYQQRLEFEDDARGGSYEFVFPMGLTPKYDSPAHPGEGSGAHAPIAHGGKIGPVEIQVSVDAGLPVRDVTSPSHPIETIWVDQPRRFQVRLAGEQIPDRDFVLRYAPEEGPTRAAGWVSGEPGQAFFLATLLPPVMDLEAEPQPREFIFVLDRSGSMTGEPIRQARNALRACLRALNPGDTFSILLFDNQAEWYLAEPAPVTQDQVNRADAFLGSIQGRGGTEIVQALEAVLALRADPRRTRYIVFLTDGAVSAEARLLDSIRGRIGPARVFTFGIGPSVNRALLSRMAAIGRGRASFLQLDEDIEGTIMRFQDSVSFPALTDLTLEWEDGKAWDIYPSRLPDLYYGQPLDICGRLAAAGKGPVRLALRGRRAGQPVTIHLALPQPAGREPVIERLWARARVDDLLDQMEIEPARSEKIRAEVLGLALEYNLVTTLTSFVAVDQLTDAVSGKPRIIHVAQPLPQGLYPGAFGPAQPPMTAMSMLPTFSAFRGPLESAPRAVNAAPRQEKRSIADQLISRLARQPAAERGQAGEQPPANAEALPDAADREAVLRWLARTQNLDGAWDADVEMTAAALLAFTRGGYTTRAGSYRQVVRRAARWLAANPGKGLARFIRARALEELAGATQDPADLSMAQSARQSLAQPSSPVDAAALGQPVSAPAGIHNLDDLRLAGILRARLAIPPALLNGPEGRLAHAWAAAV